MKPSVSANALKHRQRPRHFLAAYMRSPRGVGSVIPSSRRLADAMAALVDATAPGAVIELGPGTGVVTNALLKAGITPARMLVIERDEKLHDIMAAQFPELKLLRADAVELEKVLHKESVTTINAIVSSLPLLAMPKPARSAIEQQMLTLISGGGIIVQFTYGPKSPISRHQLRKYHISGKRVKIVLANLPPAHVWLYKKN